MSKSDARDAEPGSDIPLTLSVTIDGASDEEIAKVTEDLRAWIQEAGPNCDVTSATEPGKPGSKGLLMVLGSLALKLFEPGAVKALANCLAVFIKERRKDVTVTVKGPDGRSCQFKAGGISHDELAMLVSLAQGNATPASGAPRA